MSQNFSNLWRTLLYANIKWHCLFQKYISTQCKLLYIPFNEQREIFIYNAIQRDMLQFCIDKELWSNQSLWALFPLLVLPCSLYWSSSDWCWVIKFNRSILVAMPKIICFFETKLLPSSAIRYFLYILTSLNYQVSYITLTLSSIGFYHILG